jgi:hypothetical protein
MAARGSTIPRALLKWVRDFGARFESARGEFAPHTLSN